MTLVISYLTQHIPLIHLKQDVSRLRVSIADFSSNQYQPDYSVRVMWSIYLITKVPKSFCLKYTEIIITNRNLCAFVCPRMIWSMVFGGLRIFFFQSALQLKVILADFLSNSCDCLKYDAKSRESATSSLVSCQGSFRWFLVQSSLFYQMQLEK